MVPNFVLQSIAFMHLLAEVACGATLTDDCSRDASFTTSTESLSGSADAQSALTLACDEPIMLGGAERPQITPPPLNITTDFSLLPATALARIARHYDLEVMSPLDDAAKPGLIAAVSRHFGASDVDEGEALAAFSLLSASSANSPKGPNPSSSFGGGRSRKRGRGRKERRGSASSASGGSSSAPTPRATPTRTTSAKAARRGSRGGGRGSTYGDMISEAITELPGGKGTLEEICERIEANSDARDATLNWEMESGPRRIPVWKASVRKIINLNYGNRFKREAGDGDGPVYSLSR